MGQHRSKPLLGGQSEEAIAYFHGWDADISGSHRRELERVGVSCYEWETEFMKSVVERLDLDGNSNDGARILKWQGLNHITNSRFDFGFSVGLCQPLNHISRQ